MINTEAEVLQKAQADWLNSVRITVERYEVNYFCDRQCYVAIAYFSDGSRLTKEFYSADDYRFVEYDPAFWKALQQLEDERNENYRK